MPDLEVVLVMGGREAGAVIRREEATHQLEAVLQDHEARTTDTAGAATTTGVPVTAVDEAEAV